MTKTFSADEVRISIQTVQGQLNATPKWLTLPAASCNVKASEGFIDIDSLSSGGEPTGSFLSGIEDIAGSISFNMQYALMAFVNEIAIGAGTTVDLTSDTWADATIYTVGQVVHGTTPATDDLVVDSVVGAGTSGAVAPDTTSLADGDTIVDNEVVWIVRKAVINNTTGGIEQCQTRFAIEVKVSAECSADTYYFRKLDCVCGSAAYNFAKDASMMKTDISVIGAISETNINADGTIDATYEDLSIITGNVPVLLENGVYIKQSDIDFTLNGATSDYVSSFSMTIDNGVDSKNLLSKNNGNNTKAIFSSKRSVTGSVDALFDAVIFGQMDGVTTQEAIITMDMGNGEYLEYKLPHIKLSKDEPDFSNGTVMLAPTYAAEYKTGSGSALQYEGHSTAVAFK